MAAGRVDKFKSTGLSSKRTNEKKFPTSRAPGNPYDSGLLSRFNPQDLAILDSRLVAMSISQGLITVGCKVLNKDVPQPKAMCPYVDLVMHSVVQCLALWQISGRNQTHCVHKC